jgi:hypothetical protein
MACSCLGVRPLGLSSAPEGLRYPSAGALAMGSPIELGGGGGGKGTDVTGWVRDDRGKTLRLGVGTGLA